MTKQVQGKGLERSIQSNYSDGFGLSDMCVVPTLPVDISGR